MIEYKDQKVRDPVHGLIVFRKEDDQDQLAWKLLNTPEFQRLRRIRQLGVSEFVYPGATHTRFAHSIGVFHTARMLVEIIEREMKRLGQSPDARRAEVAVLAALLHDLGHGPFSHAFEGVLKDRKLGKKHETWSAEIIRNSTGIIRPLLESRRPGLTDEIAALLEQEDPSDIYHAVVSSSFDADRLDYLRRDRMMTGTHAGAIDFDWLMEHVRVEKIGIEPDDDEDGNEITVPTFCLDRKALPAAEQFLLARYTLHEQVYFHKTTRCIEKMIARLLGKIAEHAMREDGNIQTGLAPGHPLLQFFGPGGQTLDNYLALDDLVVWGAVEQMQRAADSTIADLACRLRERRLYKTLDLREFGSDAGVQTKREKRIGKKFPDFDAVGHVIIKDDGAKIGIYAQIGGDDERMHKKLHVIDGGRPREISAISEVVKALAPQKAFTRYYFESESDRDQVRSGRRTHD